MFRRYSGAETFLRSGGDVVVRYGYQIVGLRVERGQCAGGVEYAAELEEAYWRVLEVWSEEVFALL